MSSLKKAFDILDLFLEVRNDELRLSEIANGSGLKLSTVNRICSELVERGYLKQSEKRGKYSLGRQFIYFADIMKQKNAIKNIAKSHLVKLNSLVKEKVVLANWDGKKIYYVDEIDTEHVLRIVPNKNAQTPLYCTGIGKICLASMSKQDIEKYFRNTKMKIYTPNTITDPNQIKKNLLKITQEGVAYDDEEHIEGVRNVTAAVKDSTGQVVSCVGVLGPSVRLTKSKIREIVPYVKDCAMQISRGLGYCEDKL